MSKRPVIVAIGLFALIYFIVWAAFEARSGPPSLDLASRPQQTVEKLDSKGIAPAPDISIAHNGKRVSLSQFKGKVVLIDFWATWCGPCRDSIPDVQALYEKYGDRGFQVIGPAMEHDRGDLVPRMVISLGMTYPVGLPTSREEVEMYGASQIPFMVLVDKKGVIRWTQSGYGPSVRTALEEHVRQLLAES